MLQRLTAVQYGSALQGAVSCNLPGALPTTGTPGQHLCSSRLSESAGRREQLLGARKYLTANLCDTTNTNALQHAAECLPAAPRQTAQDGQPCHCEGMQVGLAEQQEQTTQIAEQICVEDAVLKLQSL